MKLSEIQSKVETILSRNSPPEGLEFAQKLENALKENDLKSSNPEAYKEISHIVFALYVFGIPLVSDEVLERILQLNILEAIALDFGEDRHFIERLDLRYTIYTEDEKRERLSQLIPSLKQNEEYLGEDTLPIADEQKPPMVKHWLEYYDQEAGLEGHTAFDRSKFISSDPIVQSLAKHDRELLRKVCRLYDFLQGEADDQNIYEVADTQESQEQSEPSVEATEVEPEENVPHPETDTPASPEPEQDAEALAEQMNDSSGAINLKNMPTESSQTRKPKNKAIDLKNVKDDSKK